MQKYRKQESITKHKVKKMIGGEKNNKAGVKPKWEVLKKYYSADNKSKLQISRTSKLYTKKGRWWTSHIQYKIKENYMKR